LGRDSSPFLLEVPITLRVASARFASRLLPLVPSGHGPSLARTVQPFKCGAPEEVAPQSSVRPNFPLAHIVDQTTLVCPCPDPFDIFFSVLGWMKSFLNNAFSFTFFLTNKLLTQHAFP